MLISIQNEREWAGFCTVFMEEPNLPQRPGFETNVQRVANRDMVDSYIAERFAALTRSEAADKLLAANVAFGFVNGLAELAAHPALRRITVETPQGPIDLPAPPAVFSDGPRVLGPVPEIGSHSTGIRSEFAA